jgi:isoleucyl-tRNA synthetase
MGKISDTGKKKYREYKQLNLPEIEQEILQFWKGENLFERSVAERSENKPFIFYEGPPSANGLPGIHHVISRTLKDLFCRYKTMQGYRVERKGGWDTHGLPVELSVEKTLGISKEDIGKKISVQEYNDTCRNEVLKYKSKWEELTEKMGYWVDLKHPYITYDTKYIETLWYLLKELYKKNLLYKGYTIQPYSPAAGTGLSSAELNQPGTYKPVKDTTIVAQFKVIKNELSKSLYIDQENPEEEVFLLAWTTTPWTLPSNCALAVGKKITYRAVVTENMYTKKRITVVLADDRYPAYFPDTNTPPIYHTATDIAGELLAGISYEPLLPLAQPEQGDAYKVILGDFVSTEDGTGIVHIAPSFGADDFRVAKQNNIGALTLVDKQGKFVDGLPEWKGLKLSGRYVKNYKDDPNWKNPDIDIAVTLKENNAAFRVEKYEHNYPHCWRTDKPVIYYPLDSWFIKTTAAKERLIALNRTINWKPKHTGEGRFEQWLENLVDWNLSRSRYWGTPLPIWRTNDGTEEKCIGSIKELKTEYDRATQAGCNDGSLHTAFANPSIDLHKPFVDEIILVSDTGKPMYREADLIDVWFDSGAMPYAQLHYPFENADTFKASFPADFISEGVDQTRGWFFTLHVLATLLFDSVAYKNVLSNGLVLDKNGNKMSKRLGNTVNPFETIQKFGADATRWYLITNAQPWDNLKFDAEGIAEVQRKFFGTLLNTYSFFALYANVDGFTFSEKPIPPKNRTELDRWILSLLNTLVQNVTDALNDYEPTRAGRLIQDFTGDHLSNWYVRLSRRRFWKSENSDDKLAAYQTLYTCLETLAKLMAPIAPFFAENLFRNLNLVTSLDTHHSVHLAAFPTADTKAIDKVLEERMQLAQDISSTVLALRKKENLKVRQPLSKIMIPVLDAALVQQIRQVADLIKTEVNIKEIEFIHDTTGIIIKKIKPNYKVLGKKLGADMKAVANAIGNFSQEQIVEFENSGKALIAIAQDDAHKTVEITLDDVEISGEDIPGWLVANAGNITVALDITVTQALKNEGNARELVSKLQKLRKDMNLEITDKISVSIIANNELQAAIQEYKTYICAEILAGELTEVTDLQQFEEIEVNDGKIQVQVNKM